MYIEKGDAFCMVFGFKITNGRLRIIRMHSTVYLNTHSDCEKNLVHSKKYSLSCNEICVRHCLSECSTINPKLKNE
jgi:hypothetical protein